MRDHSIRRSLLAPLAQLDLSLLLLSLVLIAVGCLFIFAVGQANAVHAGNWKRQLCWALLGTVFFIGVCCVDYRRLGSWSWLLYALGITMLVLVLLFGTKTNEARSWLPVPLVNLRLQPAEFAKPATVLLAAWLASRPLLQARRWLLAGLVLVAAGVPILLICFQPDYGTALVFVPLAGGIIVAAGMPWKWLAAGLLALILAAPVIYRTRLQPHQKSRIRIFLSPSARMAPELVEPILGPQQAAWLDKRVSAFCEPSGTVVDTSYNVQQSLLAVGSGGMWGKGFMRGTQNVLGFLPSTVAPTDFIFSVIAEEAGFVGAGAVICAFIGIVLCCLRAAFLAADAFGVYLATGVAAMMVTHAYINIGMTFQAAPIIGIPLPLVSYGGSFMISTMICLGLVQSVYIRRTATGNAD